MKDGYLCPHRAHRELTNMSEYTMCSVALYSEAWPRALVGTLFLKGPGCKCFRLHGPFGLCTDSSVLMVQHKSSHTYTKSTAVFTWNPTHHNGPADKQSGQEPCRALASGSCWPLFHGLEMSPKNPCGS